jgi:hypothetical protein
MARCLLASMLPSLIAIIVKGRHAKLLRPRQDFHAAFLDTCWRQCDPGANEIPRVHPKIGAILMPANKSFAIDFLQPRRILIDQGIWAD